MLLFMDGMAHYDSPRIGQKYSTVDSSACTWTIVPEGRFGNCIKRVSTANSIPGFLTISPLTTRLGTWTPQTGGVCGFAIKVDDLQMVTGGIGLPGEIFQVREGASHHMRVVLNPEGTFSVIRYVSGTYEGINGALVVAQSVEGLTEGTWMYLEFKWVIHPTAGMFEVRVNGTTVASYTGKTVTDEIGTHLNIWNTVRLLAAYSNPSPPPLLTIRICDLYLADLSTALAADVSDFLGDGVIDTILPNGVGASATWTPNAGANWDAVNDRPAPDDDATYVRALTPGLKDVHHFEDIPIGSVVKGIHVNILTRKEGEGSCAVAPIVHQGSTDYLGPTQGVVSPSYDRYVTQAWDLNPATNAKFTDAEINAGQFGVVKVT